MKILVNFKQEISDRGEIAVSYLVQKNFLHKIAINLKIDQFLNFSSKKNEKMNISILADSIESLIGALYLDGGFKKAKKLAKF